MSNIKTRYAVIGLDRAAASARTCLLSGTERAFTGAVRPERAGWLTAAAVTPITPVPADRDRGLSGTGTSPSMKINKFEFQHAQGSISWRPPA